MKRALTLTGAILGLTGGVFLAVLYIITLVGLIEIAVYGYASVGAIIFAVIFLTVSIIGLVFSAIAIPAWNKSAEDFKKKKGKIIVAVVFNFISVIANLIMLILGAGGLSLIFLILGIVLSLASAILFLVDVGIENGRIQKQQTQTSATTESKFSSAEVFEDKLSKLNLMKEHGIISEKEYSEIKKSFVKEFLD